MDRIKEKEKYDMCYVDPAYKLGPYRKADLLADVDDIIAEYGPFENHCDISAGRGELIEHVKSHNIVSQGTEIVDDLITDNVQFAWTHDLPFADEQFEFVTNCDAIEHYLPEDSDACISEIMRITKKMAYLTISNLPAYKNGVNLHINIKPYEEWKRILLQYGEVRHIPYGRRNQVSQGYLVIKKG